MDTTRTRSAGRLRLGLLLGITLVLLLAAFELGLRFAPPAGFGASELKPDFVEMQRSARSVGHPYLAYALKPGWSREADEVDPGQKSHNSAGFRGPLRPREKPPGTYRIVCVGGSSTYGASESSDEATWPARLEARLNENHTTPVEVLNFGVYGYSTFESLVNLSFRAIDYAPDLVIVYHTINDARFALWNAGGPVQPDNTHLRAVWPLYSPSPGEQALENSYLYLAWRKRFTDYLARFKYIDALAMVGYDGKKDQFTTEVPSEVGFQSIRRNLVSIQAVAQAHGARTLFVTQGGDWADIASASRDRQLEAIDRVNAIVKDVAEERGLLLLDARPSMEAAWAEVADEVRALEREALPKKKSKDAAEQAEGRRIALEAFNKGIFTGDVHLTDKGSDLLSRLIAEKITATRLFE